MKVTVCFGSVSVVVPCGDGNVSVRRFTDAALARYKKAIEKPECYQISVQRLQAENGAILDPDDVLSDVVDHNEQIVAVCDVLEEPVERPESGRDSASMTTCSTPEIYANYLRSSGRKFFAPMGPSYNSTSANNPSGNRFGSGRRPASTLVNSSATFPPIPTKPKIDEEIPLPSPSSKPPIKGTASPPAKKELRVRNMVEVIAIDEPPMNGLSVVRHDSGIDSATNSFRNKSNHFAAINDENDASGGLGGNRFSRKGARQSLHSDKWYEAAERAEEQYWEKRTKEDQNDLRISPSVVDNDSDAFSVVECKEIDLGFEDNLPLGVTLAPAFINGKFSGLYIDQILKFGRIGLDKRLSSGDRLVKVNGISITQAGGVSTFEKAEEILMRETEKPFTCKLECVHVKASFSPNDPDESRTKPSYCSTTLPSSYRSKVNRSSEKDQEHDPNRQEQDSEPGQSSKGESKSAPSSRPVTPGTLTTSGTGVFEQSALQKANTRKIGQRIPIRLAKGSDGLGFTVTTRDINIATSSAEPESLIYVKNILPRGTAILDGKLKAGDRILEINGTGLAGKAQRDVVDMLRAIKEGEAVELVVSRHKESFSPVLPRKLQAAEEDTEIFETPRDLEETRDDTHISTSELLNISADSIVSAHHPAASLPMVSSPTSTSSPATTTSQQFSLRIGLNESGSAGLGISVKGLTTKDPPPRDLGIFIRKLMAGGAAAKDGRLEVNDQLLSVNEHSLLGLSNDAAMAQVRRAMQELSLDATHITLNVKRRGAPSAKRHAAPSPPKTPDGVDTAQLPPPNPHLPPPQSTSSTIVPNERESERPLIVHDEDMPPAARHYDSSGGSFYYCHHGYEGQSSQTLPRPSKPHGNNSNNNHNNQEWGDGDSIVGSFDRDAPGRQSMSEKRHASGKADPSGSEVFQKIKHTRQASAPILDLSDSAILSSSTPKPKSAYASGDLQRAWSIESGLSASGKGCSPGVSLVHELVAAAESGVRAHSSKDRRSSSSQHKKTSSIERKRPTNPSFRNAVDRSFELSDLAAEDAYGSRREVGVDVMEGNHRDTGTGPPPLPPRARTSLRDSRDSSKSRERKGSGSSSSFMRNIFKGLSGGSPKASSKRRESDQGLAEQEAAKRAAEEEKQRIREQYEKLKRQKDRLYFSEQQRSAQDPLYVNRGSPQYHQMLFNAQRAANPWMYRSLERGQHPTTLDWNMSPGVENGTLHHPHQQPPYPFAPVVPSSVPGGAVPVAYHKPPGPLPLCKPLSPGDAQPQQPPVGHLKDNAMPAQSSSQAERHSRHRGTYPLGGATNTPPSSTAQATFPIGKGSTLLRRTQEAQQQQQGQGSPHSPSQPGGFGAMPPSNNFHHPSDMPIVIHDASPTFNNNFFKQINNNNNNDVSTKSVDPSFYEQYFRPGVKKPKKKRPVSDFGAISLSTSAPGNLRSTVYWPPPNSRPPVGSSSPSKMLGNGCRQFDPPGVQLYAEERPVHGGVRVLPPEVPPRASRNAKPKNMKF